MEASMLTVSAPTPSAVADTSRKKATKPLLGTPVQTEAARRGGLLGEALPARGSGGLLGETVPARGSGGLLGEAVPARGSGGLLGDPVTEQGAIGNQRSRSTFGSFTQAQLANERVLAARIEKRFELKELFKSRDLEYPANELFFRVFKRERQLEVWARDLEDQTLTLVKTYNICALAGQLGPKRTQGDNQTPEGFYYIDSFNPTSGYFLSLRIDYPNKSDRLMSTGNQLGGDIVIHGGCRTEGCLAVTDDAIKELYWMAVETRDAGQRRIPVHIFPARLTDSEMDQLVRVFPNKPHLHMFWANLKPGYEFFEATKRVPLIDVDNRGRYRVLDLQVSQEQIKSSAASSVRAITSQ